jgi:hypothetical protein
MTQEEMIQQMKAWENSHETRQKKFWAEDYPKMSFEDKIIYWRKDVFNAMQFQEDNQRDPYSAFSKDWMDYHRSVEPDFDKILPEIVQRLSLNATIVKANIGKD